MTATSKPIPTTQIAYLAGFHVLVFEQHRIRAVAVERRVRVDQVHAFIGQVLLHNIQVIAVEQGIFRDRFHRLIIEGKNEKRI